MSLIDHDGPDATQCHAVVARSVLSVLGADQVIGRRVIAPDTECPPCWGTTSTAGTFASRLNPTEENGIRAGEVCQGQW